MLGKYAAYIIPAYAISTIVIGGIFSSTLLTLYVLPALYGWFAPTAPAVGAEADGPATQSDPSPLTQQGVSP